MTWFIKTHQKYSAQKAIINGKKFDSKKEAKRYCELINLERAGAIKDLEMQKPYELQPAFKKGEKTYRAITYYADFVYIETRTGKTIVEDVKGFKTEIYKIKKKLFEYKYPDLTIIET